ncbi:hypothetical protein LR066_01655, partial [candidate division WOR-3 bacterium]|nr:hypothetical protein [candidate division WOR-3 bacterium]
MFPKRVLFVLAISFALYGVLEARGISVRLLEDKTDRCKVKFGVEDYTVEEVYIDGKKHSKILVSGGSIWLEQGYPKLPKFARSIIIPDDGIMKFKIVDIEYK